MNREELHFLQISGNCAAVGFLGPDRPKGPVDNCVTFGVKCLQSLFDGTYVDKIRDGKYTTFKRVPNRPGDSSIGYTFDHVMIVHSDPTTDKYLNECEQRYKLFFDFLNKVKNDESYGFIYTINEYDMDKANHRKLDNHLEESIEFLRDVGVLDKTIFVSTKQGVTWWDFGFEGLDEIMRSNNLKYITLYGMNNKYDEHSYAQFDKKVVELLNNS